MLQRLNDGTALLKLAKRGGMKPDPRIRFLRPIVGSKGMFLISTSLNPLHGLGVAKQRRYSHAEGIEKDADGIDDAHLSKELYSDAGNETVTRLATRRLASINHNRNLAACVRRSGCSK